MLWPTGRISVNGYSPLSQLMHSAVSGARSSSSTIKTVVHLANGWSGSAVASFYNQIFIAGEFAIADGEFLVIQFFVNTDVSKWTLWV
jgi:arabinogalactan endo-1,4-beta-galactosidase